MNRIFALLILLSVCSSCTQNKCPEGINVIPMYGDVPKCDLQLQLDKEFIKECDAQFSNRGEAAKFHVDRGWEYFYENDMETAMKRFNQAWLLDSLNADVYWGFGNILGASKNYGESIPHFEKSI